jgi:integral membrane protein (TIGR01906 family)
MTRLRALPIIILTLIIPFFLIMTAVRIMFTPLYMEIEYRMPYFPADPYGFTLADRLKWSNVSLDYLYNSEGIDFLARQRLPDGKSLYNERELSHMVDVKVLLQSVITAWNVLAIILAATALFAWWKRWLSDFGRAVSRGGWLTLGLIGLIIIGVVISFYDLFTYFHEIFFTGDTWLFDFSDTLIRLFPLQLWQDAFIGVGIIAALLALGLAIFAKRLTNRA